MCHLRLIGGGGGTRLIREMGERLMGHGMVKGRSGPKKRFDYGALYLEKAPSSPAEIKPCNPPTPGYLPPSSIISEVASDPSRHAGGELYSLTSQSEDLDSLHLPKVLISTECVQYLEIDDCKPQN